MDRESHQAHMVVLGIKPRGKTMGWQWDSEWESAGRGGCQGCNIGWDGMGWKMDAGGVVVVGDRRSIIMLN